MPPGHRRSRRGKRTIVRNRPRLAVQERGDHATRRPVNDCRWCRPEQAVWRKCRSRNASPTVLTRGSINRTARIGQAGWSSRAWLCVLPALMKAFLQPLEGSDCLVMLKHPERRKTWGWRSHRIDREESGERGDDGVEVGRGDRRRERMRTHDCLWRRSRLKQRHTRQSQHEI